MLNPAHILEIALLLLVAFLLGAVVGSLARLAVSRLMPAKAATLSPVAASAVTTGAPAVEAAPALVAAPVIGEVVRTPTPTAPADVPAPDFTEALLALAGDKPGSIASKIRMPSLAPLPTVAVTKPADEMRPARVAGETTSGRVVAHPRTAAEPARIVSLAGAGAEVIPFPLEKVATEIQEQPAVVAVATPAPETELSALIVAMAEQAGPELKVEPEVSPAVEAEVQAETPVAVEAAAPVETISEEIELVADAPPEEAPVAEVAPAAEAPLEAQPAEVEAVAQPDVVPTPPPEAAALAPEPSAEDDEGAAMRAIEGNWSPRRSASPRVRKAALPEVAAEAAIAASAAAVASAAQAANEATAVEPEAPGKPVGIPAPRLGVKDDLTHVIGILPIIETALNNLGLYHFDQIADLSDENAGWIENHLGIAGRIGREHWREQARELALAMAGTKKAAGQQ